MKGVYHFFSRQAFLPILTSSLLGLVLFSARVWWVGNLDYRNLVWNLFLAWIPYLLSLLAMSVFLISPKRWWLLLAPIGLWLVFFPNAPYIVTDFLHLTERPGAPIWYDILMLATFAWSGLIIAAVSLRIMQSLVQNHLGWFFSWMFVVMTAILGGLGIYLGRFSRFNSWDLFLNPDAVLADLLYRFIHPLANLRFFGFTILYGLFLLIVYLAFHSLSTFKSNKDLK